MATDGGPEGQTTYLVNYLVERIRELEMKLKLAMESEAKLRAYCTRQLEDLDSSVQDHEKLRDLLYPQAPEK